MTIFFSIAMTREAQIVINELENKEEKEIRGFRFITGKIGDKNIIIGVSGVGLINMSSLVSIAAENFEFDYIINFGLFGGYGTEVHKGNLVIGEDVLNTGSYFEKECTDENNNSYYKNCYVTFTDGGEDTFKTYKCDNYLLDICKNINIDDAKTFFGRIGASDSWTNDDKRINMLYDEYEVLGEDMESVAIYQLAEKMNLKAICIKGVSNNKELNEEYDDSVLDVTKKFVMELIKRI